MCVAHTHTCVRFPLAVKSLASVKYYLFLHHLEVLGRCAHVQRQAQTHTFKHAPARIQTQELVQASTET